MPGDEKHAVLHALFRDQRTLQPMPHIRRFLDHPVSHLLAYTPENAVAEKHQAVVVDITLTLR